MALGETPWPSVYRGEDRVRPGQEEAHWSESERPGRARGRGAAWEVGGRGEGGGGSGQEAASGPGASVLRNAAEREEAEDRGMAVGLGRTAMVLAARVSEDCVLWPPAGSREGSSL